MAVGGDPLPAAERVVGEHETPWFGQGLRVVVVGADDDGEGQDRVRPCARLGGDVGVPVGSQRLDCDGGVLVGGEERVAEPEAGGGVRGEDVGAEQDDGWQRDVLRDDRPVAAEFGLARSRAEGEGLP